MKKSLREALNRAKQLSISHPACKVYVMDKPYQRAQVHISEWCVKERILEGWYGVTKFLNGEECK